MTALTRLLITIFLGGLGIHKFIDKKPLQGVLYIVTFGLFFFGWIIDIVMAVQFYNKTRIDKIENTCKILAIIFSVILMIGSFGQIGTEDFDFLSFLLSLISSVAIIKIFIIDNKNHELSYGNINITHKSNNHVNKVQSNPSNTDVSSSTSENEDLGFRIRVSSGYNRNTDINDNKIGVLSGNYYNEQEMILDKYKDLKTPNYIIIQINEQLNPTGSMYYVDDMVELSNKYKDKYVESADFYPFSSYWAQIRDLNEYQLKWYLFWRKEFLNGHILDTDISYIFIFSYELICYTFNQNAAFNVSVLEKLYNSYKDLFPKLSNYLPEWIDDMLSEVGYFFNQNDNEIDNVEEDMLVNSLTSMSDLDKININIWRKHYNENKSELTNKQLSLIYGNQKFNNRLKKYAGSLAKYYIDNKIDIVKKWFEIKVVTEKKSLFNSVPCSLERREGTFKYKKFFSNSVFEHDLNQITKLCFDLVFPPDNVSENDYVINQYSEGKYELPEEFFYMYFKRKTKKDDSLPSNKEDTLPKKEFSIDMNVVSDNSKKIDFVKSNSKKIDFSEDEIDFFKLFEDSVLEKRKAQQYFIKKGVMLNAYITKLNEKYYSSINKEVVSIEDDILRLNIETEEII